MLQPIRRSLLLSAIGILALVAADLSQAQLTVSTAAPAPREVGAGVDSSIVIDFDRPIDPSTLILGRTLWAFGRWSGPATGSFSLANSDQRVVLTPNRPFSAGEQVMVLLSNQLRGADGSSLRPSGYSWQFWTAAKPTQRRLEHIDTLTTRTMPGVSSRAYGGFGADVDGDGFLDISIVNEDTNDVRVFLNPADSSGLYPPFLEPTTPVGGTPSPSETADFDHDGVVDVAVANITGDSVSILLGNGDGSFAPQQEVSIANSAPRGIAVLDANGDGSMDIAVTGHQSGTVSILLNDGNGIFGAPSSFGSFTPGEWSLAAGDLDEDGILDLVVGDRDDQRLDVYTGDGDGTFSLVDSVAAGGNTWMLALGDVDGDGHEDVVSANSSANNGARLLGDGTGQLASAVLVGTDSFPLANDLGDIDGDGDLDWSIASFSGDWQLFVNDGTGGFTFDQEFPAPDAASCSLLLDIDNDGDLDMALIDELADVVHIYRNSGLFADDFESTDTTAWSSTVP